MAFDEMDGGNSGAAFAAAVNDAVAEEALTCWLRNGLHREFGPVTADPLPMEWLRMLEGMGSQRDEP